MCNYYAKVVTVHAYNYSKILTVAMNLTAYLVVENAMFSFLLSGQKNSSLAPPIVNCTG